ncbi:hypothetical protein HELRODRAFT_181462 [Helobdella robusta]|uniref:BEACH domain-containing protein n=1 Tax=Helobdella robusta TaxID=6412 RepID=T1FH11_HELRO|nr:hypothetical protein HELRODRAFT_181462 [Helobdella robusta]ESN92414.1 hypothetical protein HELRODRAFT_181462 [Helobdella robusta]
MDRKNEEKMCNHLITSARRRDHVIASKQRDRVINLLTNRHGAWGESSEIVQLQSTKQLQKQQHQQLFQQQQQLGFWKLDNWEDDSRRRRRFVRNPFGTKHADATLKAAIEHGATEDAINAAREAYKLHHHQQYHHASANMVAAMVSGGAAAGGVSRNHQQQVQDTSEEDLSQMDERDLEVEFSGPVALSTHCKLISPGCAVNGTLSITKVELYFEMDEDDERNKKILRRSGRSSTFCPGRVSMASPKQIFKMSNMTQKWQRREITNFDYLMYLNTVAGRTYCDLNQYPVYPWVIVNYESSDLDLNLATNYRDLSKPIGALNPTRRSFFEERYNQWDNTDVPAFHYGTHYSTAAFVLNWLIRVELIPEFYYLSDMFVNTNNCTLGTNDDGDNINNVILPPWAKSPEDFVRIMRMALESEIVSIQLHQWIDLIFGYKQRGPEAIRSTNVFYYLTYEGSVNLDSISDPVLREAIENQIQSFGQTPSQLLTEPHPPRSSPMNLSPMMFTTIPDDVCMIMKFLSNSPVTHVSANTHPSVPTPAVITLTCNYNFAVNKWNHAAASSQVPTPGFSDKSEHQSQLPLTMDQLLGEIRVMRLRVIHSSFVVTADNRHIIAVGFWDRSFRVFNIETAKITQTIFGHLSIVTCVARSECSVSQDCYVVTGSKDCTLMLWHWVAKQQCILGDNGSSENATPKATLTGHKSEVTCAIVSAELGIVVSGSLGGPVLIHTNTGDLLRSLDVPDVINPQLPLPSSSSSSLSSVLSSSVSSSSSSAAAARQTVVPTPRLISLNREGYITVAYDNGALCSFSINGKVQKYLLHNSNIQCMIMNRDGQYLILSGDNGVVEVWRSYDLTVLYSYPKCDSSVRSLALSHDQKFLMAGLATGCLIVFNIDFNRWNPEFQEKYQ